MSVDDLLDELDGLLRDDAPPPKGGAPKSHAAAPPARTAAPSDDIDALLADLDADVPAPARPVDSSLRAPPAMIDRKPAAPSKSSAAADTQTNMRCTNCDFRVLCFRDHEWTKDADLRRQTPGRQTLARGGMEPEPQSQEEGIPPEVAVQQAQEQQ